jgi:hypothetical protein
LKERCLLVRRSHNTLETPGIAIQYHDEHGQPGEDRWSTYTKGIHIAKSIYDTINLEEKRYSIEQLTLRK